MLSLLLIYFIVTLNFFIFRVVSPVKDPTELMTYPITLTQKRAAQIHWGLDKPLFPDQYLQYVWNMVTWNYGFAWAGLGYRQPIAPEMLWRLRNTVFLLAIGLAGSISIGLYLGVYAASRRGKKADVFVMGTNFLLLGMPSFLIQTLFLMVLSFSVLRIFGFQILPSGGVVSFPPPENAFLLAADITWHAAGPVITMVIMGFGGWAYSIRQLVLSSLTEDFIQTARAKGLPEKHVLHKHALRSVFPPIATMIAMSIPGLVTGSVMTEIIFNWPGIGSWMLAALTSGNYPVAEAVLFNFSVLMIFCNLISDILYGLLDPRIKTPATGSR